MNGADMLCDVLLVNGIDVCFANPGTSEMHFVAALDRKPGMRCVLGLSEGVVTGAADGYARMADKPAATLLHLGPGLANGLANLHNARRARTPMVNIVGDHASYHLKHDAPLTSDIESLARPMSHWVGRAANAAGVRAATEEAYRQAQARRGVSTLILPADAAWGEVVRQDLQPVIVPAAPQVAEEVLRRAAKALRSGKRAVLILSGRALRTRALETAGQISAATGAALFSQTSDRTERGASRVFARPIPYNIDLAVEALREFEVAICLGGRQPVGFFAYPDKPSTMLQHGCEAIELAGHECDLAEVLRMLAEEIGLHADAPFVPNRLGQSAIAAPTGALNADSITIAVARMLPENAIICEESITSAGKMAVLAPHLVPHDHIPLTGGAIGIGIPLAAGAAIACPERKVIALQADGSGMYTLQGLWTQAREQLNVITVIFANRAYAILQGEMRNVGVSDFGRNARRMLDLDNPELDWCALARGMGVEAARADTIEQFSDILAAATTRNGPFLIEARI
ncbi:acetolactate synthase-1/2/3 large subunit [Aminobacter lissarensis]|uniref:Acetolactate synthase-1/2/3 large subunit n=1 Tax=Aminobacter carboxidus TaxID=376165 RepID=A0A8E1WJ50_9HYPH|nr:acetolactate synthase large subunit [Aminobacter lissarensis]MBB6468854.1 acetolactate synthase-1/2/3 large subunit [Aminobacter lissarensis]